MAKAVAVRDLALFKSVPRLSELRRLRPIGLLICGFLASYVMLPYYGLLQHIGYSMRCCCLVYACATVCWFAACSLVCCLCRLDRVCLSLYLSPPKLVEETFLRYQFVEGA